MEIREICEKKVAELDARMDVLNKLVEEEKDPEKFHDLCDEIMSVARATNKWLRAMGAVEKEMYDI